MSASLWQVCNHPYLNRGLEDQILTDLLQEATGSSVASSPEDSSANPETLPPVAMAASLDTHGAPLVDAQSGRLTAAALAAQMIAVSGKLVLLDKLLPKLRAGGHKVLIFSQVRRSDKDRNTRAYVAHCLGRWFECWTSSPTFSRCGLGRSSVWMAACGELIARQLLSGALAPRCHLCPCLCLKRVRATGSASQTRM